MARNEEKAMSMFNKWVTMKKEYHMTAKKRPFLTKDTLTLPEAQKHRQDIIRDITKKIAAIQNAALGEHMIRDTNDSINKLLREKYYWECRIRELGGGDYTQLKGQNFDAEGKELPGAPGYKYFGAAKDLPGVRELFQQHEEEIEAKRRKRSRADIYRNITPDYYGYVDEDDEVLVVKESAMERLRIREAVEEYDDGRRRRRIELEGMGLAGSVALQQEEEDEEDVLENTLLGPSALTDASIKAHVPVPSQDDIARFVIEQRKRELMNKYGS